MQPLIISTKARGLIKFFLSFKLTPSVLSLSCWPLNFPFSYSNWGHIIESCHSSCWGWGGGSSNTIWGWVRFAPGGRGKRIEKILKEAPAGISSAFLLHLPAEETFFPACKAHSRFWRWRGGESGKNQPPGFSCWSLISAEERHCKKCCLPMRHLCTFSWQSPLSNSLMVIPSGQVLTSQVPQLPWISEASSKAQTIAQATFALASTIVQRQYKTWQEWLLTLSSAAVSWPGASLCRSWEAAPASKQHCCCCCCCWASTVALGRSPTWGRASTWPTTQPSFQTNLAHAIRKELQ